MKVFSVVDNSSQTKSLSNRATRKASRKAKKAKKLKKAIPPRQNVTADQIRQKVAAHSAKKSEQGKLTKARMAKFNANKLPDMQDKADKHVGDVGLNNPNDLATHGKLKRVLSMGGFSFNEKERAALEKILQD